MIIRESKSRELEAIYALHMAAFDADERELVAKLAIDLIKAAHPLLSLVAVSDDLVIGHILFSPVSISNNDNLSCFILAPLAVSPARQRQGVGSQLIEHGLRTLTAQGADVVFVLGDPDYYSRSGFHPVHDVSPSYSLPYPEAWQAKELRVGALQGVSGTVECVSVLMSPELW
ncbi:GNAT family N-acetyltransferase [Desulfotalea psychrophila]|uniref:N-acetyltransferase domain-containing protein n=1 Tax=Desulfotalea psychrophila (strain LSv54 / DSM 12343) TaxID=177439 RepID=Q6ARQ3_DESPS|nr:N-acetyltransferase [Desulfotalea psychrophila]CAG34972.1 hypothetical protein DP0243 [Desulfotalea psychrophila LSv54]